MSNAYVLYTWYGCTLQPEPSQAASHKGVLSRTRNALMGKFVTPRPIGRDENILRRVRVGIEPRPLSRQTNDQTICTQNTEIPGPRGLVIAIRVTPTSGALHYPSLQSAMSSLRLRPAGDCDWLGLWPPGHGLGPSGPPIVGSALRPPVSQISLVTRTVSRNHV